MTKTIEYRCNVCGDEVDGLSGVGFMFKSAKAEFGEGNVNEFGNHLCNRCINAIHDLSHRGSIPYLVLVEPSKAQ